MTGLVGRLPPRIRRMLKAIPGASGVRDRLYGTPGRDRYPSGSLRPVVYLPTWVQWEVMKQRPQYLLQALADAGHDVYFVDPQHRGGDVLLGRVNISASLASVPGSGVIVYTHFAPTRTMLESFEDAVVVYDILDDLSIYDPDEVGLPVERTVRYHHDPLVGNAAIVLTSNEVLAERHRSERSDLILIENGVDPDLFTPDGETRDLGSGPVIGFHGAIRAWIDFDLLSGVVRARPGYRFVLVGPVLAGVEKEMADLLALPNVVHVGEQPVGSLAAYVRSFTVGIIPYVVDATTSGVNPMKLNEYLASGVPVVATPLPSCIAHPLVGVADDVDSWAVALDAAVETSAADRAALRSAGVESSWDRRITPLLERLEKTGSRNLT